MKIYQRLIIIGIVLLFASVSIADDAYITTSIAGVDETVTQMVEHEDGVPFKGTVFVEVTNSGSEAWGDFHFGFYDPIGGQDISNLYFNDASLGGMDPTSSQANTTWLIDNVTVGATMDVFFYSDPVLPGGGYYGSLILQMEEEDQIPSSISVYPQSTHRYAGIDLLDSFEDIY